MWRCAVVSIVCAVACGDNARSDLTECSDGDVESCNDGSEAGACRSSTRQCEGGAWSACSGRIDPVDEICNGIDDDCDGVVDGPAATDTCGETVRGTAVCVGGACVAECDRGFGDCNGDFADGCESDLRDPATCGVCNLQCAAGLACEFGSCQQLPRVVFGADLHSNLGFPGIDALGGVSIAGRLVVPLTIGSSTVDPTLEFFSHQLYVARFDPAGVPQFLIRDGDTPSNGRAVSALDLVATEGATFVISEGDTTIAGQQVGPGFVGAYDASGVGLWAHSIAPELPITLPDPSDLVRFEAGAIVRRDRVDGHTISSTPFTHGAPIKLLADGSVVSLVQTAGPPAADCSLSAAGPTHLSIAAVDPSGDCQIKIAFAVTSPSEITARPRSDGGFILGGRLIGTVEGSGVSLAGPDLGFLIGIDAQFAVEWSRTVPDGIDFPGLALDDRDNIYTCEFDTPTVIASYRVDGSPRWRTTIDSGFFVFPGTACVVNAHGRIAITAAAATSATLGDFTQPSSPFYLLVLDGR